MADDPSRQQQEPPGPRTPADQSGDRGPGAPAAAGPADKHGAPAVASEQRDSAQHARGIVRVTPADLGLAEQGGEAACYAHLVCPECGWVVTEGHRPGCPEAAS